MLYGKKIRKLRGKFIPNPLPSLKINNNLITDPLEVSEKLGEHFSNVSSAENYSSKFKRIYNAQVSIKFGENNKEAYNAVFTFRELREALLNTENSSPGEDNILYEMLKHLPEEGKKFLLKIL